MHKLPFMIEEVDACEMGKFISYRYRNEKNDKFIVTCFHSIFGKTYRIYRLQDEYEYKIVAQWRYNNYNFLSDITNIVLAESFDFDEMKDWLSD